MKPIYISKTILPRQTVIVKANKKLSEMLKRSKFNFMIFFINEVNRRHCLLTILIINYKYLCLLYFTQKMAIKWLWRKQITIIGWMTRQNFFHQVLMFKHSEKAYLYVQNTVFNPHSCWCWIFTRFYQKTSCPGLSCLVIVTVYYTLNLRHHCHH